MGSVCTVVELQNIRIAVNNKKHIEVFILSARYCCPVLTESGVPRQISVEEKFHENTSSGSRVNTVDGEINGQTEMMKPIGVSR